MKKFKIFVLSLLLILTGAAPVFMQERPVVWHEAVSQPMAPVLVNLGTISIKSRPEIVDFMLRTLLDNYVSTKDVHSTLIIFTECYGGDKADDFKGRCGTTVLSATSPGEPAYFGGYEDDAALLFYPDFAYDALQLHEDAVKGKDNLETPIIYLPPGPNGKPGQPASLWPVNPDGELRGRQILVYAGIPEESDKKQCKQIKESFANEPNTTVTLVGGTGETDGFKYPGTLEGLRNALAKIKKNMKSGEQFILFVTDHGDIHRAIKDVTVKTGETKLDMTLDSNFRQQLNSTESNDHLTGVSIFIPGEIDLKKGDISVTINGIEYKDFEDYGVDLDGDGKLGGKNEGHQVFFRIPEFELAGNPEDLGPHQVNITIKNKTDKTIQTSYITIDSGAIERRPSSSPQPPPDLNVNCGRLNFGMIASGHNPRCEVFTVSASNETGCLDWTITDDADWLICTPLSGTGFGSVGVSVDGSKLLPGNYSGTISVSAPYASNSPQTVAVSLGVYAPGASQGPFGHYSTPTHGAAVNSSVPFTGWVLDDIGVDSVKLYRQESSSSIYIGDAILVEGARPDVEEAYPGYPMNYKAGWGYMMLTNFLPNGGNGTFNIQAVATDYEGNSVTLGTKTIMVDNANAVKPFGTLDTPSQGGMASGSGFQNWGWVLTPEPKHIPMDGSTINVWVDGVNLGNPTYNIFREDIYRLFPGYANSHGAGGYFNLDTTTYCNGVHTIQWTAADNSGDIDGIGSRYFTISNIPGTNAASKTAQNIQTTPGAGIRDLNRLPIDHWFPVRVRKGFDEAVGPEEIFPDEQGLIRITTRETDRVEINFSNNRSDIYQISGYMMVGDQIRSLPIGTTLKPGEGTFCWQPGPGFCGEYRFIFLFREKGRELPTKQKTIVIKIMPRFE